MRNGIDFFPMDVTLDTKFELIEAEFGLNGFAVIIKLFQAVYGGEGYYLSVNDDWKMLFSRKIGMNVEGLDEIIQSSIRRGIFDGNVFEKYGVLTSKGIQQRYFEAVSRRKSVDVFKEYLLGNVNQSYKNVNILQKNVNISEENVNILKQSKVEESKVKDLATTKDIPSTSIEERYRDIACPEQSSEPIFLILKGGSVFELSQTEIARYQKLYPGLDCTKEARKASKWLEDNPKRRKTKDGIKRFLNNWMSRADSIGGSPDSLEDYSDASRYEEMRGDDVNEL